MASHGEDVNRTTNSLIKNKRPRPPSVRVQSSASVMSRNSLSTPLERDERTQPMTARTPGLTPFGGILPTNSSSGKASRPSVPRQPEPPVDPAVVDEIWATECRSIRRSNSFQELTGISEMPAPTTPQREPNTLPAIPFGMSRCKIACTLGPSPTDEYLNDLLINGMSIARINFSFGTFEMHKKRIAAVRRVSYNTKKICAIMVDTRGPSLRIGSLKLPHIELKPGQPLQVTSESIVGDETRVSVRYPKLAKKIPVGTLCYIGGKVGCAIRVRSAEANNLNCEVEQGGQITEGMRCTFEDVSLDLAVVSQQDVADIMFAAKLGVDFIGVSDCKSRANIDVVRKILEKTNPEISIYAKIENETGVDNFDDILAAADGIVVARGDLLEKMEWEKIDAAHRKIITKCNNTGKPVITSSQMLQSMVENLTPSETETREITNSVVYGTDVFMLCSETSTGKHPIRAVATLSNLLTNAERDLAYSKIYLRIFNLSWAQGSRRHTQESIASSAVKTAFEIEASIIIVLTQSGEMTRFVAKYRPACSILCITDDPLVARQCQTLRATFPLLVGSMTGSESLIGRAIEVARDVLQICSTGDKVVVAAGMQGMGDQMCREEFVLKTLRVQY